MGPPGQKVSSMLMGNSRGQLLIAPERMKRLGQSGNDAQSWMDASGGESKTRCCKNNMAYMNLSKLRETANDRGAWCAAVHGVAKCCQTRLGN